MLLHEGYRLTNDNRLVPCEATVTNPPSKFVSTLKIHRRESENVHVLNVFSGHSGEQATAPQNPAQTDHDAKANFDSPEAYKKEVLRHLSDKDQ